MALLVAMLTFATWLAVRLTTAPRGRRSMGRLMHDGRIHVLRLRGASLTHLRPRRRMLAHRRPLLMHLGTMHILVLGLRWAIGMHGVLMLHLRRPVVA